MSTIPSVSPDLSLKFRAPTSTSTAHSPEGPSRNLSLLMQPLLFLDRYDLFLPSGTALPHTASDGSLSRVTTIGTVPYASLCVNVPQNSSIGVALALLCFSPLYSTDFNDPQHSRLDILPPPLPPRPPNQQLLNQHAALYH